MQLNNGSILIIVAVIDNKNHHQNNSIIHAVHGQGRNQYLHHSRGCQNHRNRRTQRQHWGTHWDPPQDHHLGPQDRGAGKHPVHRGQSPEQCGRGPYNHIRWVSDFIRDRMKSVCPNFLISKTSDLMGISKGVLRSAIFPIHSSLPISLFV